MGSLNPNEDQKKRMQYISNGISQLARLIEDLVDWAAIESGNKLATIASNPSRLLVAFTGGPQALRGLAALAALVRAPERLQLGEHAAYLWCPNGILGSKAADALLGKLGREATTRNWATVLKISALLRETAG